MSADERVMAREHGLALRDPRLELGWRRTTTFLTPSITGGRARRTASCPQRAIQRQQGRKDQA